jgi:biopolymer transport protein ExbD
MGMKVGDEGNVKSEPNVVPMIDIMLVLLIIFMIVTPVITAGFTASMPQGKNLEKREEEEGDVTLGIDNEGNFYLDPGTGKIGPVHQHTITNDEKLRALEGALRAVYDTRAKDKILYFKADKNLPFAKVEAALEVVRKSGVRVLAAVTEQYREPILGGGHGGGN